MVFIFLAVVKIAFIVAKVVAAKAAAKAAAIAVAKAVATKVAAKLAIKAAVKVVVTAGKALAKVAVKGAVNLAKGSVKVIKVSAKLCKSIGKTAAKGYNKVMQTVNKCRKAIDGISKTLDGIDKAIKTYNSIKDIGNGVQKFMDYAKNKNNTRTLVSGICDIASGTLGLVDVGLSFAKKGVAEPCKNIVQSLQYVPKAGHCVNDFAHGYYWDGVQCGYNFANDLAVGRVCKENFPKIPGTLCKPAFKFVMTTPKLSVEIQTISSIVDEIFGSSKPPIYVPTIFTTKKTTTSKPQVCRELSFWERFCDPSTWFIPDYCVWE